LLRLCGILQGLKNGVSLVMRTANYDDVGITNKFKTSIKALIDNRDMIENTVTVDTLKQSKLLLDYSRTRITRSRLTRCFG
jgi:hypothetical protein